MTERTGSAAQLIGAASRLGLRIAVAESLTGGLLAAEIVSVPGASRVFSGGVVAYDTALKHTILGVDAELLHRRGPVDEEVARQMAAGVRRACAVLAPGSPEPRPADLGLATTGVAGPESDPQTGQAAGTVWVAVSGGAGERSQLLSGLAGLGRDEIRASAVEAALRLGIEALAAPAGGQG